MFGNLYEGILVTRALLCSSSTEQTFNCDILLQSSGGQARRHAASSRKGCHDDDDDAGGLRRGCERGDLSKGLEEGSWDYVSKVPASRTVGEPPKKLGPPATKHF